MALYCFEFLRDHRELLERESGAQMVRIETQLLCLRCDVGGGAGSDCAGPLSCLDIEEQVADRGLNHRVVSAGEPNQPPNTAAVQPIHGIVDSYVRLRRDEDSTIGLAAEELRDG